MDRIVNVARVVTAIGIVILAVLALFGRLVPPRELPSKGPEVAVAPPREPPPQGPGVAYASTTVNCESGKSFAITTGTNAGSCNITKKDGFVTGGTCKDGANEASADCTSNEKTKGACGTTSGSGNCSNAPK